MAVKVVDGSVVVALVFGEPRAGEAAALLGDAELVAPTLFRYELSKTAWKKARRHPSKAPLIAEGLRLAGELDIEYVGVDHGAVLELALERNVTAYDASYLWLETPARYRAGQTGNANQIEARKFAALPD
jgi:predicted nucleic acid-binding protein